MLISYRLTLPAPSTHYLEIEARFPLAGASAPGAPSSPAEAEGRVELAMAVWTPGSYLVREFSRNVERLRAETADGTALPVARAAKNRWWVEDVPADARELVVRYAVYARELSVRTNYVGHDFALINGAPTFLTLPAALAPPAGPARAAYPHEVRFELPEGWEQALSPLPIERFEEGGVRGGVLRAASYDELVDSPLVLGSPEVYEEEVDGVVHRLVNVGEAGLWDGPRSAAGMARVVGAHRELWGSFPYPRYTFFNLLVEGGGGLEHRDSTVLMASRTATRTRERYLGWLGLVSHELFHAWNGKRLRPVELGPFDYEAEVYTESLWVVEGVTSYYDDLLVHRAGLSTRDEYLKSLSKGIADVQSTPGRLEQPLDESSFDAWIKLYRRDENSVNRGISYYRKGALVAWLLDVEIRRASGGERSLDDLLRRAFDRYSGDRGYTRAEIEALASEVARADLSGFFRAAVEGVGELDFQPALDWFGLRFQPEEEAEGDEGAAKDTRKDEGEGKAWLGMKVETRGGLLTVTEVRRGGPAFEAGLSVDDELIALDGYRVAPGAWEEHLKGYRPGDEVELLVARQSRLLTVPTRLGRIPQETWKLEADPEAGDEQKARLAAWLGSEAPAGAPSVRVRASEVEAPDWETAGRREEAGEGNDR